MIIEFNQHSRTRLINSRLNGAFKNEAFVGISVPLQLYVQGVQ